MMRLTHSQIATVLFLFTLALGWCVFVAHSQAQSLARANARSFDYCPANPYYQESCNACHVHDPDDMVPETPQNRF